MHSACGRACAGEDVPQTITDGVTVHVCSSSGALAAVLIYVTCPEVPKEFKEKQNRKGTEREGEQEITG